MARDLFESFGIAAKNVRILHNPVDILKIQQEVWKANEFSVKQGTFPGVGFPHLLCVGRLSYEKGLDLLLPAVAQIKHQFPAIRLTIAGTGPEESALRSLSYKLNLDAQIEFVGYQSDLSELYREATIFVLPSRYEGMPNALLEAAAAGLPIVATQCCRGVTELLTVNSPLENLPGTWLTASISTQALAETLMCAIHKLKESGIRRYRHSFLDPFELDTAIHAYEEMLVEAAAGL